MRANFQHMSVFRFIFHLIAVIIFFSACNKPGSDYMTVNRQADIFPAYQQGTVIPYNIAPMNFIVNETGSRFFVRFSADGNDLFDISCKGNVSIPMRKWKKMLNDYRGKQFEISIFVKESSAWTRFSPLSFTIAHQPVDPYLAYRLIEPGYEIWGKMGIYQRNLENFVEKPIIINSLTDGSCMNCHSFNKNDPQTMLFHLRQKHAGTIILKDGNIDKINTRAEWMISPGVYPRWHPQGRFVAFSVNTTRQEFHTANENKVEVYDMASDLMIYDTQTNTVFTDSTIFSQHRFETFPEWSPDGKYLYFSSTEARQMPDEFDVLRYDLLRVAFDATTGHFGNHVDTIVSSLQTGKSVTFARISPDGKYIVFCMANYGSFPVWHRDSDLFIMNLETQKIENMMVINSNQSESYHSWSSNGRWIVFGSRRMDGTFTRPFICYFDTDGKAYPPFPVPQKNPMHYKVSLKSYNIPEFITGKVAISPHKFAKAAKGAAINVNSL